MQGGEKRATEVVFRTDPVVEQVVVAAAMADREIARHLVDRIAPDAFLEEDHRRIWSGVREAVRRQLGLDPATVARLAGDSADVRYVAELAGARPTPPDAATLAFHVDALLWNRQRYVAATGPIAELLGAIEKNDGAERTRALARAVAGSFEGWSDRQYLHDNDQLIDDQVRDVRARAAGRAIFPTGIAGLDRYDAPDGTLTDRRRVIPGIAPSTVTVVTGIPGSGKSTFTARMVLGLMRQRRKVLFGAWEMRAGTTIELLACLSLGWSRTDLTEGRVTEEQIGQLRRRMEDLRPWVRFLANPFRRRAGGRHTNAQNLDVVQGYIADSGCHVFVADLWKRCLVETRPEDEEEALYRQQAIAEEMGVAVVMVQQQRLKDIELRPDKRPTREGIKGSGAWTEVADNIFGIHRPALWKPVPDSVLEVDVLKQRYGRWPLAVEFDWDPERGKIEGGRAIEYDQAASLGESGGGSNPIDQKVRQTRGRGDRR